MSVAGPVQRPWGQRVGERRFVRRNVTMRHSVRHPSASSGCHALCLLLRGGALGDEARRAIGCANAPPQTAPCAGVRAGRADGLGARNRARRRRASSPPRPRSLALTSWRRRGVPRPAAPPGRVPTPPQPPPNCGRRCALGRSGGSAWPLAALARRLASLRLRSGRLDRAAWPGASRGPRARPDGAGRLGHAGRKGAARGRCALSPGGSFCSARAASTDAVRLHSAVRAALHRAPTVPAVRRS